MVIGEHVLEYLIWSDDTYCHDYYKLIGKLSLITTAKELHKREH